MNHLFSMQRLARRRALHFCLTSFLLAGIVCAQDYERVAPKEPAVPPPRTELAAPIEVEKAEKELVAAIQDREILIPELKGLVIVSDWDQVLSGGLKGVRGLRVNGMGILAGQEFDKIAREFLGKPVTQNSINLLVREIVDFYRNKSRLFVNVFVPEQDITEGVLQLVVMEGRAGQVRVEGNKWFATEAIRRQVHLSNGGRIWPQRLLEDVNELNSNPFRKVDVVFTPGKKRGQTDVVLKVKDRFPVRAYTGYENSGTDLTADERWLIGFNWGNVFKLDHRLNYQFMASPDFDKLTAHSGSYYVPLPWRHSVNFFGSYSQTHADLSTSPFNLEGKSWQTSTRYRIPLPAFGQYTEDISVGFDFKNSNNNLDFGGRQVFSTTTEVAQWASEYQGTLADPWGGTTFGVSGFFSPGGLSDNNTTEKFEATRAFAKDDYIYGRFNFNRTTRLPYNFSWIVRGIYQLTSGNLLGSEQLGLGGYSSVRGYDEREINGDEGLFASTELRTPPISLCRLAGLKDSHFKYYPDQLQFLGFFDYGFAENYKLLPGEDPHIELASAGPGVRYAFNPYLTLRFDYGWQFYRTGFNTRNDSRGHLGIVFAY